MDTVHMEKVLRARTDVLNKDFDVFSGVTYFIVERNGKTWEFGTDIDEQGFWFGRYINYETDYSDIYPTIEAAIDAFDNIEPLED